MLSQKRKCSQINATHARAFLAFASTRALKHTNQIFIYTNVLTHCESPALCEKQGRSRMRISTDASSPGTLRGLKRCYTQSRGPRKICIPVEATFPTVVLRAGKQPCPVSKVPEQEAELLWSLALQQVDSV